MHQFPKGPEDLLLPPVEQGEAPTVQSFHGKVLRHSFRAFIAKSSVEQGKAPTAEVTSCELRKKVGIYLCVYIHVNIIVKVEYSSRERSGRNNLQAVRPTLLVQTAADYEERGEEGGEEGGCPAAAAAAASL